MAIAFDTITQTNNSTASYSHTTSGSNRFLILAVITSNGTAGTATYNGISLTFVRTQQWGNSQTNWLHTWALINPTTGTNTISITQTGLSASAVLSYTGVKQTGQPEVNSGSSQTTSNSCSNSIITTTANSWVFGVFGNNNGNPTSWSNLTERGTPGGVGINVGDSNGVIASPSSYTMTANFTGANVESWIQIAFAPATANNSLGFFNLV